MKKLSLILLIITSSPLAPAEDLTQVDREALLEKLEAIRSNADSKVDARFRAAITAYKSAVSSDDAALELFLKCEEMVNFDEMKKKPGEFRDWKRDNAELLSKKDFKMALRHQLRWLILTLEASSNGPDANHLATTAGEILVSILSQAEDLAPFRAILQQPVTASSFARAYGIQSIKTENWPLSPTQIQPIYSTIILPPLRRTDRLPALKAAWTQRIVHEGIIADLWSGDPKQEKKPNTHSPEFDKFISNTLPKLQWEAELDLFKAGDQRAAALRMLAHIEKNLSHEAAPTWAAEFTSMLQVNPLPDASKPQPK